MGMVLLGVMVAFYGDDSYGCVLRDGPVFGGARCAYGGVDNLSGDDVGWRLGVLRYS